jgi:AAA domain
MKIISADARLAERRGVKMAIFGPTGVGKTSSLRTLDPARTLFIDIEAGDLSVQDVKVDTVRVDTWQAARDLACRIGGPNPSFPPTACYSPAHFEAVGGALPLAILEKVIDDFNVVTWQPQMEGARTGRELPGIVDQVITMQWIDFGDGKPTRAFVCTSPNAWNYPAKDRAGRLEQIEEPHLGKLVEKLTRRGGHKPASVSVTTPTEHAER